MPLKLLNKGTKKYGLNNLKYAWEHIIFSDQYAVRNNYADGHKTH